MGKLLGIGAILLSLVTLKSMIAVPVGIYFLVSLPFTEHQDGSVAAVLGKVTAEALIATGGVLLIRYGIRKLRGGKQRSEGKTGS